MNKHPSQLMQPVTSDSAIFLSEATASQTPQTIIPVALGPCGFLVELSRYSRTFGSLVLQTFLYSRSHQTFLSEGHISY